MKFVRFNLLIVIVLLSLLSPSCLLPEVEVVPDPGPVEAVFINGRLEEVINVINAGIDVAVRTEMDNRGLVGVAVGVIQDGAITYLKGYGYQDLENDIPVLAKRTMFRWASISKTLAAVVAIHKGSDGTLDLDASITTIYPEYVQPKTYLEPCNGAAFKIIGSRSYLCGDVFFELPYKGNSITSRMLLGHLAGIPHYSNGRGNPEPPTSAVDAYVSAEVPDISWSLTYLADKPLVHIPGSDYDYSTFGFNLLGVVLERAANLDFAELVRRHVIQPSGLTTLQPDYEWVSIANRAFGYSNGSRVGSDDVSYKLPGGGYISTTLDLAKYCRALMGPNLLKPVMKNAAWTAQTTSDGTSIRVGLGFFLNDRNGNRYVEHSGGWQKARTRLRLYPDDNLCIVVMSNTHQANTRVLVELIEDAVR